MVRCRAEILLRFSSLACIFLLLSSCTTSGEPALPCFLAYGRVFEVDLERREIHELGYLHLTAPSFAVAPDGAVWGRAASMAVGPARTRATGDPLTIRVEEAPYLVAHDGDRFLYVSHNTARAGTTSISVVDTVAGSTGPIGYRVPGLTTDLAVSENGLYVASVPFSRADRARLSVYPVAADRTAPATSVTHGRRDLAEGPPFASQFRFTLVDGSLYLVTITGGSAIAPVVQVLRNDALGTSVNLAEHSAVTHVVGDPRIVGRELFVPTLLEGERSAVAVLASETLELLEVVELEHPASEVVVANARTFAYLDSLATAGAEGLQLSFVDRASGKEVKRIQILRSLKE